MRRANANNQSTPRIPFLQGAFRSSGARFFCDLPSDLIPRLFPFLQSPFRSSGARVFGVLPSEIIRARRGAFLFGPYHWGIEGRKGATRS
jgi:hypothetical protein